MYVEVTSTTAKSHVVSTDYEVSQSIALSTGLTYVFYSFYLILTLQSLLYSSHIIRKFLNVFPKILFSL